MDVAASEPSQPGFDSHFTVAATRGVGGTNHAWPFLHSRAATASSADHTRCNYEPSDLLADVVQDWD